MFDSKWTSDKDTLLVDYSKTAEILEANDDGDLKIKTTLYDVSDTNTMRSDGEINTLIAGHADVGMGVTADGYFTNGKLNVTNAHDDLINVNVIAVCDRQSLGDNTEVTHNCTLYR